MSDELADYWNAHKAREKARRKRRRKRNEESFDEAVRIAKSVGVTLVQNTDAHYQLRYDANDPKERWLTNVWPSTGRVWRDNNWPARMPHFPDLPDEWTLIDLAKALRDALETGDDKQETP